MDEIAKVIVRLRKSRGWSQLELARRLDCRQATVSDWENGRYVPSQVFMAKLERLFGADAARLLELDPGHTGQEDGAIRSLTRSEIEHLADHIGRLGASVRVRERVGASDDELARWEAQIRAAVEAGVQLAATSPEAAHAVVEAIVGGIVGRTPQGDADATHLPPKRAGNGHSRTP